MKPEDRLAVVSIRLSAAQAAKFKKLGLAWLRRMIDAAKI